MASAFVVGLGSVSATTKAKQNDIAFVSILSLCLLSMLRVCSRDGSGFRIRHQESIEINGAPKQGGGLGSSLDFVNFTIFL